MSRLLTPEEIVFAPQNKENEDGEQDEVEVSGLPD